VVAKLVLREEPLARELLEDLIDKIQA